VKVTECSLRIVQPTTEDHLPLPDQSEQLKALLSELAQWSRNSWYDGTLSGISKEVCGSHKHWTNSGRFCEKSDGTVGR